MAGLIVKLIVCPLTVGIASYLFPNVNYTNVYQVIIVGLVLAISAHMMEIYVLRKGSLWTSTVFDFMAATIIVYLVSLLIGAEVTLFGAVFTALLLSVTEVAQHWWLIQSGRTKKSVT